MLRDDPGVPSAVGSVAVSLIGHIRDIQKIALESGMNGHLAKPYDIPKMMETLAELLN